MTAEKRLLTKLKEIDRLDKLSTDLMDTDEEASDLAYEKMWAVAREVADVIVKSTFGKINNKIALTMIFHKRDKLIALCKRFA